MNSNNKRPEKIEKMYQAMKDNIGDDMTGIVFGVMRPKGNGSPAILFAANGNPEELTRDFVFGAVKIVGIDDKNSELFFAALQLAAAHTTVEMTGDLSEPRNTCEDPDCKIHHR